jgi:hypothetical protein
MWQIGPLAGRGSARPGRRNRLPPRAIPPPRPTGDRGGARWTGRLLAMERGGPAWTGVGLSPGCEPGLAELARVIRPGGSACIVDNDGRSGSFVLHNQFPPERAEEPTAGSPQLVGHDLDRRAGAAILGRPAPLLEPALDHDPAALRQGLGCMLGLVAPHDHGEERRLLLGRPGRPALTGYASTICGTPPLRCGSRPAPTRRRLRLGPVMPGQLRARPLRPPVPRVRCRAPRPPGRAVRLPGQSSEWTANLNRYPST